MDREIKFRAWDKERKCMVYNKGALGDNGEDCELMQYTGLKDSNGIEIYEGDIVRVIHTIEGQPAFSQCIVRFDLDPPFSSGFHLGGAEMWKKSDGIEKIDVVGNVYENPFLSEILNGL